MNNLKQEIKEYKELVSRPVTTTNNVYNDNSKKTNYNIQLNPTKHTINCVFTKYAYIGLINSRKI